MKTDFLLKLGICLGLITLSALANQDAPEWITKFKSEDPVYKYYFGVSDFVESQAQAAKDATQNARGQAIEENFGVDALYQTNLIQTEVSLTSHSEMVTRSKSVRLIGFERVEQYEVGTQMFLKFRYSKIEIQKEKDRLAQITDSSDNQSLETSSESTNKYPTTVNIHTDPSGAHVFVDGKSLGISPLTLKGHLAPGAYNLFIQKDSYQDVNKPMVIVKGQNKVVSKLTKAKATLNVNLDNFSGASVYLNGTFLGKTPLEKEISLSASTYNLKISHPLILPIYKEIELESDEIKKIQETAELKKVLVRVLVFPKTAVFRIQDQEYRPVHNTLEVKLAPGDYTLEVSAENYEPDVFETKIVPGKENFLGTVKLVKIPSDKVSGKDKVSSKYNSSKNSDSSGYLKNDSNQGNREPSYVGNLWEKARSFETYYQVDLDLVSSEGSHHPVNKGSISIGTHFGASVWNRTFDFYIGANAELFSDVQVGSFQEIRVFGLNSYAGGILHLNNNIGFGYETGKGDFISEKSGEFTATVVPKYKLNRGFAKAFVSFGGTLQSIPVGMNIGIKNYLDQIDYYASDRQAHPSRKSEENGTSLFIQFFIRKY